MIYTNKVQKAIEFASEKHKDQKRKVSHVPYIMHPLSVMFIVSEYSQDEDILSASVLHDVVEDTDSSIDEIENTFGSEVKRIVSLLSEDKNLSYLEMKKEYFSRLLASRDKSVFLVKSADILCNLRDCISSLESRGCEFVRKDFPGIDSYVKNQEYLISRLKDLWFENPLLSELDFAFLKAKALLLERHIEYPVSCGIVPFFINEKSEREFLLIEAHHGAISFPKGHVENEETFLETAQRELLEETSLVCKKIHETKMITEYYLIEKAQKSILKTVHYFLGQVDTHDVVIQEEEIKSATWLSENKCLEKISHQESKEVFKKALDIIASK